MKYFEKHPMVMILIGIFTGAFTGMCAQLLTERLKF